jgi:PAS domain S-box-containing protein
MRQRIMEPQHILIVDDTAANRKVLRVTLEAAGLSVVEAENGVEALALLDRERVDAIISDILMPRMDGYRFCHEVRRHKRHKSIPFIFYTNTYTSPADEKLGLGVGAQSFVRKPATTDVILRALETAAGTPVAAPATTSVLEIDLLTDYNERLVAKLEEKNIELEQRTYELEKAQSQLQHFVAKSPVVIYALDVEGETASPAWLSENISALTGYDVRSALQPNWWMEHLHPEDRDRVVANTPKIFQSDQSSSEYRVRRQDGSYVWIQDDRRLIRDPKGKPVEILGSWLDVSERKRVEQQLLLQSTALEAAANAILVTDGKGVILWVNRAFTALTGYTAEEVRGKTPRVLKSGKHDRAFYANLWETILSGNNWRGEFINRRKDGSLFHGEHTITPVRSEGGAITHFAGIMDDITRRREIEEELKRRAEALAKSNAELARFNRLAVGRELRMVELKQQVNELCQQLGKPPVYDLGRLAHAAPIPARPGVAGSASTLRTN